MKRRIYLRMKSLEEARELWFSRFDPKGMVGVEEVPTLEAAGRVTAAPVMARRSSPAAHQAAMDGFAVPAAATFGATPENPGRLHLGREAFPVNTGHLMPPGTDAVIMVEQIPDPEADPIVVEAPVFPWQHVRRVGEDLVRGEMVLSEGSEISPWSQGALLAAGVIRVKVRRRPRVAIIPTGSELVPAADLEQEPAAGRLPEFNSVILSGLVAEAGGLPQVQDIVPDDLETLIAALQETLAAADLVLINAGSSAGTEDYTYQAVAALGQVLVHGVAMMPGKPTLLGVVAGKPVIGNPGYPVSAVLSFEQFAGPLIAGMAGKRRQVRPVPDGPSGPEPAFPARPHRIHPGNPGPGGGQGHRHPPAPGRGRHHFPGAGRRPAHDPLPERRPGGGPPGGRGAAGGPGGDRRHPGGPGEPRQRPGPPGHPAAPPRCPAAPLFRPRRQPGRPDGPAPGPGPPGRLPPVGPREQHLQHFLHPTTSRRGAPETHQSGLAPAGPDGGPGQPQKPPGHQRPGPPRGALHQPAKGRRHPPVARYSPQGGGPGGRDHPGLRRGRNTPTWQWR